MRTLGFLLAFVTLVTVGCGGDSRTESGPPAGSAMTAGERVPAPPIEGTTLEGEPIALADLRGKPVFVNVWSSW